MPEDLPTPNKSLKEIEKEKNSYLEKKKNLSYNKYGDKIWKY